MLESTYMPVIILLTISITYWMITFCLDGDQPSLEDDEDDNSLTWIFYVIGM